MLDWNQFRRLAQNGVPCQFHDLINIVHVGDQAQTDVTANDVLQRNGGDFDMNVMINNSLQFGLADDFTAVSLKDVVGRYVRLGLITNMDNVDEIMDLAWNPVLG